MQLNTTLSQRLSQQMVLAPRMIQSMEILQLPIMALQERILQELQENPVLELRDTSKDELAPGGDEVAVAQEERNDPADPAAKELVIEGDGTSEADFDRLEKINEDRILNLFRISYFEFRIWP